MIDASLRHARNTCAALLMLACALAGPARAMPADATAPAPAPTGRSSGVWYEIFVRAWYDTDGDGIGDLNGVTAKLDYLKSLGVDGIWLMPINPSPSYHGYDVTDYYAVNPQYGSLADFERLAAAAHQRGIKVILDLVINHTSDRHPWFRAALDPADPHRAWYTWAAPGADLHATSAVGSPAWHAIGGQHYLGDFSAGMPDLDYDTPAVRSEMIRVGRFWLDKGADGFRLDAARHIYLDFAAQEGDRTVVAKNVRWWSDFRAGLAAARPDAYLVGEVTEHTPARLAPYLGPLDAVFDFPLAERLIDSAGHQRNRGLDALLGQVAAAYRKAGRHDAPFLSNHDQERVMSRLHGQPPHMRVAAAMLLTLPGEPYVYYGEELGMQGRKPDENLREPMRWQRAGDAPGATRWKASSAGQGGEVSVEAEEADPDSLLNRYRTLIHWRAELPLLRDGDVRTWPLADPRLFAFERFDGTARVLVVHNLSGTPRTLRLAPREGHAYGTIRLHTGGAATLAGGRLTLPAYATVVLQ
ncbi:alpha-amylase family glycosyl hydrolase [Frateuria defendens]|uniref:alpha-amylase family glycosyl hydrolase n=1 Tax=Frateuria defendens TaxID=2219559 RepID=UPI0009E37D04|nr:alpha-amylase family glycosyl hydrolase [Frateuria defendens]